MLRDDQQLANRSGDLFINKFDFNVVVLFGMQNKTARNCDVATT